MPKLKSNLCFMKVYLRFPFKQINAPKPENKQTLQTTHVFRIRISTLSTQNVTKSIFAGCIFS